VSPVQLFSLSANELATATSLSITCIPSNATVVFNINGSSAKLQSIGLQALAPMRQKILFNFPQAARLELKWVGIEGSVLAPLADVINPQGNINGQAIAKAWHAQGSGTLALFHYPFTGDLSAFTGAATRNALALNQYQQGQSLFAGFDLLAQASRLNTQLGATAANPFGDLLLQALDAIKPKLNGNRAGKAIPVVLSYSNLGAQAATGQTQLTLSPGLSLSNPSIFALATANTWVQPLTLAPAGQSTQWLYLKLPASGSASIQLKLQTGTAPNGMTQFEQTFSLTSLLNP
ncbi:MAG: choice-of-anchor A family protein, partial [Sphingobacteriales bacterium]